VSLAIGVMNGAVTVLPGGTLNLTNAGYTTSIYGVLTNNGTVVFGDGLNSMYLYGYGTSQILNNGLWLTQAGGSGSYLSNGDGNTNRLFLNAGTLRTTGSAQTYILWPLSTSGHIDQQGGLLNVPTWSGPSTLLDNLRFYSTFGNAGGSLFI